MKNILFINGASVAQIIPGDGKPICLIVSDDGEAMIDVTYKAFEKYVKSLAHVFIMMNQVDEYRNFWKEIDAVVKESANYDNY